MESYDLDDAIADRLKFAYFTKIGNTGNKKWVIIEDDAINLNDKLI